jgi:hypothetical protein
MANESNQDLSLLTPIQRWLATNNILFPSQQRFLQPAAHPVDIALFQGGVGCGKTYAACLLGIQLAMTRPNTTGMVVAYRLATLRDAVLPMYRHILKTLNLTEGVDYKVRVTDRSITFANGSRIWFRPLFRSQAYKSLECQWMHAEELGQLSETLFAELLTRLRQPSPYPLQFFGTTTPVTGWIKARFAEGNPYGYRKVVGKTSENTVLAGVYVPMIHGSHPPCLWPSLLDGEDMPDEVENSAQQTEAPITPEPVFPNAVWTENHRAMPQYLPAKPDEQPVKHPVGWLLAATQTAVKQTGKHWAYWKTN